MPAAPLVRTPEAYKMIGSFLTRGLVLVFGYVYPAYECFKAVEKNKPDIEQLRFWCQYWILVAVLTVCERIGDTFISWVPMYSEAKLAFFIYLWFPKTKGTVYVYDSFFRPFISKHETEIDRNLLELRTRAGDIAVLYWQRAASYGQTRIFDILQYVAAQSTPRPRPAQPQQQDARTHKPAAASQDEQEEAQELVNSQALTVTPSAAGLIVQKAAAVQPPAETSVHSNSNETEAKQIEPVSSSANENVNPLVQETVVEEAAQVTRARVRKNRAAMTR